MTSNQITELQELFDKLECTTDLLSVVSRDLDMSCGREIGNSMAAIIDLLKNIHEKGSWLTDQMEKAQVAEN